MTNPQSTPKPAADGAAFDQKKREYARRAEEIRAANKTVLFDSLAAAGMRPSPSSSTATATAARSNALTSS
jgi:hypothetical protein